MVKTKLYFWFFVTITGMYHFDKVRWSAQNMFIIILCTIIFIHDDFFKKIMYKTKERVIHLPYDSGLLNLFNPFNVLLDFLKRESMVGLYIKLYKINNLALFMKLDYWKIVYTVMALVLYLFTCSLSSLNIYVSATLLWTNLFFIFYRKLEGKTYKKQSCNYSVEKYLPVGIYTYR